MDWVTSERSWTIGNSKGIGVSKLFPITNDLELITRHITYHLEVQEQQCNPPFKRWIKSHVTLFSMDENSYPTSCPNHACMGTEGYAWWNLRGGPIKKLKEPLEGRLCLSPKRQPCPNWAAYIWVYLFPSSRPKFQQHSRWAATRSNSSRSWDWLLVREFRAHRACNFEAPATKMQPARVFFLPTKRRGSDVAKVCVLFGSLCL